MCSSQTLWVSAKGAIGSHRGVTPGTVVLVGAPMTHGHHRLRPSPVATGDATMKMTTAISATTPSATRRKRRNSGAHSAPFSGMLSPEASSVAPCVTAQIRSRLRRLRRRRRQGGLRSRAPSQTRPRCSPEDLVAAWTPTRAYCGPCLRLGTWTGRGTPMRTGGSGIHPLPGNQSESGAPLAAMPQVAVGAAPASSTSTSQAHRRRQGGTLAGRRRRSLSSTGWAQASVRMRQVRAGCRR
mmetsp:Transcript_25190/g.53340  ORF Transcript_25190/g.53340 Transcript_25190/m.53340 type:complete len:240 (-) Transcript_25190:53-772(-)